MPELGSVNMDKFNMLERKLQVKALIHPNEDWPPILCLNWLREKQVMIDRYLDHLSQLIINRQTDELIFQQAISCLRNIRNIPNMPKLKPWSRVCDVVDAA